jgi:aconitate hydratase
MDADLVADPIGFTPDGRPVLLEELWPSPAEVDAAVAEVLGREQFVASYATLYDGDERWAALGASAGTRYVWETASTYVQRPPFLEGVGLDVPEVGDVVAARALAVLGDSITTDHISPAGAISPTGPAGRFLLDRGVERRDFNSFGARRGNHDVMVRGTFANIRLRNALTPGIEGGVTRHLPSGEELSIYEAAQRYRAENVPLVILAGKEYGSGSSRDWAAKGTMLLGVRAVLAESFERIHRSNLIGMGVLPLQFEDGASAASLGLSGEEFFDILGLAETLHGDDGALRVLADGRVLPVRARLDTRIEYEHFRHGGILPFVLRDLAAGP